MEQIEAHAVAPLASAHEPSPTEIEESRSSRIKAEAQRDAIREYWRHLGYEIECWLVHDKFSTSLRLAPWHVRSNLINGLPREIIDRIKSGRKA